MNSFTFEETFAQVYEYILRVLSYMLMILNMGNWIYAGAYLQRGQWITGALCWAAAVVVTIMVNR